MNGAQRQPTDKETARGDRLPALAHMLSSGRTVRALEAHNGLSALIVENARQPGAREGNGSEFDAIWISSLTDSTAKGKPDTEVVDFTSRLATIQA
jgi:2-methylisocitrate lyase-like PEP mutase family enzyme